MIKLQQKTRGCFRTGSGVQECCRLRSVTRRLAHSAEQRLRASNRYSRASLLPSPPELLPGSRFCSSSYPEALALNLDVGARVDYAQVIKTYEAVHPQQSPGDKRIYLPPRLAEIIKVPRIGDPDPMAISASHVERQNLTMRMMMRRLTRLTNAFSKKKENPEAALALHFGFYNFCRIHKMIRCTPAMEAGITEGVWEMKDLLTRASRN
jgi:hypothetical protein